MNVNDKNTQHGTFTPVDLTTYGGELCHRRLAEIINEQQSLRLKRRAGSQIQHMDYALRQLEKIEDMALRTTLADMYTKYAMAGVPERDEPAIERVFGNHLRCCLLTNKRLAIRRWQLLAKLKAMRKDDDSKRNTKGH